MAESSFSDKQKEVAKFLDRDFSQCFQQLRHYDSQIVDICKFSFTGYLAVIGGVLPLYKYGVEKNIDYALPSVTILWLASILGVMLFALVVRNRIYFVLMARYLNEHREFFLRDKSIGFLNISRMFTNPKQPPYFSWLSSHSWLVYLMSLLNSTMLGIGFVLIFFKLELDYWWCILPAIVAELAQIVTAVVYLRSRESKSTSASVWGNDDRTLDRVAPPIFEPDANQATQTTKGEP